MKFSIALITFAAAASAQIITGCDGKAQPCIEDAIVESGVCDAGDYACGCANLDDIRAIASPCVIEACGSLIEARKSTSPHPASRFPFIPLPVLSARWSALKKRFFLTLLSVAVLEEVEAVCADIGA